MPKRSLSTQQGIVFCAKRMPFSLYAWRRSLFGAGGLLVILVTLHASRFHAAETEVTAVGQVVQAPSGTLEMVPLRGGGAVELVWQQPARPARGVLLLLHGCSHSATDWWPRGSACDRCMGLPEEQKIVRAALVRGYVAVAVSSEDRAKSRCWRIGLPAITGQRSGDLGRVAEAVGSLLRRLGGADLPLFVLGASSGGAMALALPHALPGITAVCSQIMAAPSLLSVPTGYAAYPPTRFEHMVRDKRTSRLVERCVATLARQSVMHSVYETEPQPLTPTFFSDAIPHMDGQQSSALFAALVQAQLVSPQGELHADPRTTPWREALFADSIVNEILLAVGDTLVADESAIAEELNVAWAQHELVGSAIGATLDWFGQVHAASLQRVGSRK